MSSESCAIVAPLLAATLRASQPDAAEQMPAAVGPTSHRHIRWVPLTLVCALHAAVLVWLAHSMSQPKARTAPPALVGQLVTAPTITEPVPLPVETKPLPKPSPVVRPQPVKPPPVAAPSERAVSVPPPPPPVPDSTAQPVAEAPRAHVVPPPPPAAPAPITPPRADATHLNNPAPSYPSVSKRMNEEGRVLLDVYILPSGFVGELKLKRSSGFARLDQAALDAVRQWRYQPARQGGEPIPYWYVQPMLFSLEP